MISNFTRESTGRIHPQYRKLNTAGASLLLDASGAMGGGSRRDSFQVVDPLDPRLLFKAAAGGDMPKNKPKNNKPKPAGHVAFGRPTTATKPRNGSAASGSDGEGGDGGGGGAARVRSVPGSAKKNLFPGPAPPPPAPPDGPASASNTATPRTSAPITTTANPSAQKKPALTTAGVAAERGSAATGSSSSSAAAAAASPATTEEPQWHDNPAAAEPLASPHSSLDVDDDIAVPFSFTSPTKPPYSAAPARADDTATNYPQQQEQQHHQQPQQYQYQPLPPPPPPPLPPRSPQQRPAFAPSPSPPATPPRPGSKSTPITPPRSLLPGFPPGAGPHETFPSKRSLLGQGPAFSASSPTAGGAAGGGGGGGGSSGAGPGPTDEDESAISQFRTSLKALKDLGVAGIREKDPAMQEATEEQEMFQIQVRRCRLTLSHPR